MLLAAQFEKARKAFQAIFRAGRATKAWALAAIGIGREGKLADEQQAAAHILQRFIHLALLVAENPIAQQAFAHALNASFVIAGLHGDQGQQPGIDSADNFVIDLDTGFGNTLNKCNHARMLTEKINIGQRRALPFRLRPMKTSAWFGHFLFFLAAVMGRIPLSWQRMLGEMLGVLSYRLNTREAKVARRTFEYTGLIDEDKAESMVKAVMRSTGRNLLETLRVWTRPRKINLQLIKNIQGLEVLHAAKAQGKGLILAAPHYGNWELLIEYMASLGTFALVYRVPEKHWGDVFLRRARGGENVLLVPAETNAMRPLWKTLQAGGTVGITPDQQPKFGGGEFAPFFGKQALTLSLIPKLAERSQAPVVFAYTEATADGFDLFFEASDSRIHDKDLILATRVMNAQVEAIAKRDLRQYQWTYKRYTLRPPGSGEKNPYWPSCY